VYAIAAECRLNGRPYQRSLQQPERDAGRDFSPADEAEGITTVLVNERLVRTFNPGPAEPPLFTLRSSPRPARTA
jgi:hypothetical protein